MEHTVTRLLAEWREGDEEAIGRVAPLIYDELRRLAHSYIGRQQNGRTLEPTGLVHEFYLRSARFRDISWESRGQFVAYAAKTMRNLLVDEARKKNAVKRGKAIGAELDETQVASQALSVDVVDVHRALEKLSREYPRHGHVVELIFFGGLNASEASDVMTACGTPVSARTVERDWRFARAWLHRELHAS